MDIENSNIKRTVKEWGEEYISLDVVSDDYNKKDKITKAKFFLLCDGPTERMDRLCP